MKWCPFLLPVAYSGFEAWHPPVFLFDYFVKTVYTFEVSSVPVTISIINKVYEEYVMTKVGGLTNKFYRETRGIKVSGGQFVKAGTLLTRQGHRWQPGENVIGESHLNAKCDGIVYFTKKKNKYRREITLINIKPDSAN
ncbi:MAG: bL27 family ribosomal protein [Candidatus Omnitrophica bacterium]|nr:bL27 family ribosomal protein [Candidatus Omnitrophota bacterium]